MTLYEEQKKKIREIILDTSIELFESQGYENTSISEITKKVGIAKGTFYNYFDSKKEILLAWAEMVFQSLDLSEAFNPRNNIHQNLNSFIKEICKVINQHKNLFLEFLKEILSAQLDNQYKKSFDFKSLYIQIIKVSRDYDKVDNLSLNEKISVINNSLFMGIIDYFAQERKDKSLEEYLMKILEVCLYGLLNK